MLDAILRYEGGEVSSAVGVALHGGSASRGSALAWIPSAHPMFRRSFTFAFTTATTFAAARRWAFGRILAWSTRIASVGFAIALIGNLAVGFATALARSVRIRFGLCLSRRDAGLAITLSDAAPLLLGVDRICQRLPGQALRVHLLHIGTHAIVARSALQPQGRQRGLLLLGFERDSGVIHPDPVIQHHLLVALIHQSVELISAHALLAELVGILSQDDQIDEVGSAEHSTAHEQCGEKGNQLGQAFHGFGWAGGGKTS